MRAAAVLSLLVAACGGPGEDVVVRGSALPTEIAWVEVPAPSSARLFYDLIRRPGASRPLFVVTGGGPGAAVLFPLGFGLGPSVIRSGSVQKNPAFFADLGDLLFIDARGSGLSHLLSPTPDLVDARTAAFDLGSFNVLRDADDVLWVLRDVLDRHPGLAEGGMFFVAESYGGLRTIAMVDRMVTLPRLRGQILLQPSIAMARQHVASGTLWEAPGSVLDAVAAETGIPFVRCAAACDPYANAIAYLSKAGRSPYDYAAPADWLNRRLALVQAAGTGVATLAALLGVGEEVLLSALGNRPAQAFRFGDIAIEPWRGNGELASRVGPLPDHDAYFSALVQAVLVAVSSEQADPSRSSDVFGAMFVDQVRSVPTFVSRATRDLASYGPALAPVLGSYTEKVSGATEIAGGIALRYLDGSSVTITSPVYEGSHAVLEEAAVALHADIARFIGDR